MSIINDNISKLIDATRCGTDYDIAKLFVTVFPDCSNFSVKDFSLKLSEDIHNLIQEQIGQYCHDLITLKDKQLGENQYCFEYERINEKLDSLHKVQVALRTHMRKKQFIAEIKSIC
jgi:hypothetical protein